MSVTIFHNPRCSKSREALSLLEARGVTPEIVRYLDHPPGFEALRSILQQLGMAPRDLMRKNEAAYRDLGLDDEGLSDTTLIEAMAANPVLIERPIVLANGRAVLGRPPGNVLSIL